VKKTNKMHLHLINLFQLNFRNLKLIEINEIKVHLVGLFHVYVPDARFRDYKEVTDYFKV
jgi:hypothetical protein